ncbi:MAG: HEPN domain-containing protein [Chloroflexi bacterium]|nr:HEPN domain-containing protein [Chloroflexota bacterium]
MKKQLQLADEALSDAGYLLQDDRFKAAANRAYYAMFHAAHAILCYAGVKPPKTHGGVINLFGKHLVRSGKVERALGKHLQDAYDLRQQSDYGTDARIGELEVKQALELAETFVAEVKNALQA